MSHEIPVFRLHLWCILHVVHIDSISRWRSHWLPTIQNENLILVNINWEFLSIFFYIETVEWISRWRQHCSSTSRNTPGPCHTYQIRWMNEKIFISSTSALTSVHLWWFFSLFVQSSFNTSVTLMKTNDEYISDNGEKPMLCSSKRKKKKKKSSNRSQSARYGRGRFSNVKYTIYSKTSQ